MKYLKLFKNHEEYEEEKASGLTLPNVSHCIQEAEVHYNQPLNWVIKTKYYVSDISQPTKMGGKYSACGITVWGLQDVDHLIIDGVEVEVPEKTENGYFYQFNSVGEHSIDYVMKSSGVEQVYDEATDSYIEQTVQYSGCSISMFMLRECFDITSIKIPNSVTSIGNSAFRGCTRLASITIDNNNTVYDSRNNCNAVIKTEDNTLICGCKNTVIPNNVTSINGGAFQNSTSLSSVTIPNSVTSIGGSAFQYCSDLTNVSIGSGVTSIDSGAFDNCSSLTRIEIKAIVPPTIDEMYVFSNTNGCPIYVPDESVNAYKTTGWWTKYTERIFPINGQR